LFGANDVVRAERRIIEAERFNGRNSYLIIEAMSSLSMENGISK
jgi:hypothetical protein